MSGEEKPAAAQSETASPAPPAFQPDEHLVVNVLRHSESSKDFETETVPIEESGPSEKE